MRLEGWKIPADPPDPWIILCHGFGSNRSDLLKIAAGLHHAHFNLFLFDFRAHGSSDGWTASFGWREQHDLKGVLSYLGQQPDIPAKAYGVYGASMGAATALLVAAGDERLGAVVAESSYDTLEGMLARQLRLSYPFLPTVPFLWFLLATYRLRFGVWPRHISPEKQAALISPRPLLLIHGALDTRTPLKGAKRLLVSAANPKELWVVDGAGHLEGFAQEPQLYLRRLVQFFETFLR